MHFSALPFELYALRRLRLSLFGLLFADIKLFIAPRKSVGMPETNRYNDAHLLGHNNTLMTISSETSNHLFGHRMDGQTDTLSQSISYGQ